MIRVNMTESAPKLDLARFLLIKTFIKTTICLSLHSRFETTLNQIKFSIMAQTLFEKLQLQDEKNLLIQGLPSSIEKQFAKLSFSKNVTPLLKSRKIDFALVFAVNENQLSGILKEVIPALNVEAKLWIAYPKTTSKISTDLNRSCSWDCITNIGFEDFEQVALDHVWNAIRFKKAKQVEIISTRTRGTVTSRYQQAEKV